MILRLTKDFLYFQKRGIVLETREKNRSHDTQTKHAEKNVYEFENFTDPNPSTHKSIKSSKQKKVFQTNSNI
jgi:hypothetical protein